ncbi:MAG: hypothetical protein H7098_10055 [Oligoflexus sp.]|nr:hypothetical protein [Pseudopedobacter sp.]
MKKIFLTLLVAVGLLSTQSSAQVSINANIGSQPLWAPVGHDYVEYYYLPEIESYYYVPKKQFIYMDNNGRRSFSNALPSRYRGYDLDRGYKVVINSRDAYNNFDRDRVKYAKYKKVKNQKIIRYSNDPRYYEVKGHPHGMPPGQAKKIYSSKRSQNQGNGHVKEHGNGGGNGKGKH